MSRKTAARGAVASSSNNAHDSVEYMQLFGTPPKIPFNRPDPRQSTLGISFARRSTLDKEGTDSVDIQTKKNIAKLQSLGLTVPKDAELREHFSGTFLLTRKVIQRARELIWSGDYRAICFLNLGRTARKEFYQSMLIEECRAAGVEVHFVEHEFGEGLIGDMTRKVVGISFEYGKVADIEKLRNGMEDKIAKGHIPGTGTPPFGVATEFDVNPRTGVKIKRSDRRVLDPALAPVAIEIFERVAAKDSPILMCRDFIRRDIPSPGTVRSGKSKTEWRPEAIYRIVRNPAYKGVFVRHKQRSKGLNPLTSRSMMETMPQSEWEILDDTGRLTPRLVSNELWEAANRVAEVRAPYYNRAEGKIPAFLRGHIECQNCKRTMYPVRRKNKQKKSYLYYKCTPANTTHKHKATERCGYLRLEHIEEQVLSWVRMTLTHPETLLFEIKKRQGDGQEARAREMVTHYAAKLSEGERQMDTLVRSMTREKNDIIRKAVEKEMRSLGAEMKEWEKARNEYERELTTLTSAMTSAKAAERILREIAPAFDDLSVEEKAMTLDLFGITVCYDPEHPHMTTNFPGIPDEVLLEASEPKTSVNGDNSGLSNSTPSSARTEGMRQRMAEKLRKLMSLGAQYPPAFSMRVDLQSAAR